jgi:hypothetical protein
MMCVASYQSCNNGKCPQWLKKCVVFMFNPKIFRDHDFVPHSHKMVAEKMDVLLEPLRQM